MFKRWMVYLTPVLFVCAVLVVIYAFQTTALTNNWATKPKDITSVHTAFTGPFLHGDVVHLWGNVSSLIGLSVLFIWLFPSHWWLFFILQWVVSAIGLFILGNAGSSHIGASTWVYSFAAFLTYFSLRSKNSSLNAILFILVLWYGGMWWGLLPLLPHVSHEGHISGFITGILIGHFGFSFWENHLLPEWHRIPKDWESEDEPKNPYI